MKPMQIGLAQSLAPPPYEVNVLPGARPQFDLVPLWTMSGAAPEVVVDDAGQPVVVLKIRTREGGEVIVNIALTAAERARLAEVLQQSVRADELRSR